MIDLQPLPARQFEAARIDAELMQDRRVDVGDVVAIDDGVEAEFVGVAVDGTAFDAGVGHEGKAGADDE